MSEKKSGKRVRTSAKAIIIQNGKILMLDCKFSKKDSCLLFPGGGQKYGETLNQALKRECKEELGAKVEVNDLVWIREYISSNHEFSDQDDSHQIEFYFLCKLKTELNEKKAKKPDKVQKGIVWIELSDLAYMNIYPKAIIPVLQTLEYKTYPFYGGDVN